MHQDVWRCLRRQGGVHASITKATTYVIDHSSAGIKAFMRDYGVPSINADWDPLANKSGDDRKNPMKFFITIDFSCPWPGGFATNIN